MLLVCYTSIHQNIATGIEILRRLKNVLLIWIKFLYVRKKMSGAQTMCSASITQTVGTLRGQQMQEPCKEIE